MLGRGGVVRKTILGFDSKSISETRIEGLLDFELRANEPRVGACTKV